MKTALRCRAALFAAAGILICLGLVSPRAQASDNSNRPITASNFQQAAPRGFGDRNNSWPQAMVWWHNNLYVGTARQSLCTSWYAIWQYVMLIAGKQVADTYLPYPPHDPDLACAQNGADLAVQAEIWRWSPNGRWDRVFQSPLALDNPGPGAPLPPNTGKKLPYEIAIRDFAVYTEPDGTEALYAFGVNSTIIWDRTKLPPPRILRTTDGVNWRPVPQDAGTFLGTLPFNADHSSFRASAVYGGKLFALCGPAFGQGTLIASANPKLGNNSWFQASPGSLLFYELEIFNGWLYLGGFDQTGGYAVYKTKAQGPPPYQLITVVPSGAYLTNRPSKSVVSMHVFNNQLFVGTATFTEIIRINADDTWDLVVGSPRAVPGPTGTVMKYPISGLDAGFGHTLNDHAWQMDDSYGFLYIGTYNAATSARLDPVYGDVLRANMGAHLFNTDDSWYYSPVTMNGFSNLNDPHGGIFDYGFRTHATTPQGIFLGAVNDYYGLMIFKANTRGDSASRPPDRLEIEPGRTGHPLLSWIDVPSCKRFHVWRAEIVPVQVRDDVNIEGWTGSPTGNKIPDTAIGKFVQVAVVTDTTYRDATTIAGKKYLYYVTAEKQNGALSDPSNLSAFPLNTPPVTFAQLLAQVNVWKQRGRFRSAGKYADILENITKAKQLAGSCRFNSAIDVLNPSDLSQALLGPESTDGDVLGNKLARRLGLNSVFPTEVTCSDLSQ